MKNNKVHTLAQMALLTALLLVMAFTPLGYIPIGFMNATTMHIPVIIGACLLGPKMGGILGGIFGLTSVWKATMSPNLTSFVFTPFYSLNPDFHGSVWSLVVALLPRICIGIVAGFLFRFFMRMHRKPSVSLLLTGFVGSLVNTIGVMGLIYLFFGTQYATATGQDVSVLPKMILTVIGMNGTPEAIVAALLTLTIGQVLLQTTKWFKT